MKKLFPSNRYSKARGNSLKTVKLIEEDTELLASFGLMLDSVDPGIHGHLVSFIETDELGRTHYPSWSTVNLDATSWWWIRDLLLELKQYREQQCPATNGNEE